MNGGRGTRSLGRLYVGCECFPSPGNDEVIREGSQLSGFSPGRCEVFQFSLRDQAPADRGSLHVFVGPEVGGAEEYSGAI